MRPSRLQRVLAMLRGASVIAGVLGVAVAVPVAPAAAQAQNPLDFGGEQGGDAQMLLEADELIYNQDENTVSAVGGIRIAYNGNTLVADRVTYSRTSGRVVATGRVEIVDRNGSHIFAEEIDITDDFRDGFVSSLRVEAADNTRFAAESAERRDGQIAVFNNGVYTACEPCKEHPERPPLWQIRANRVILDNNTKRVYYEGASFELFGKPIAYVPRFSHADPSIRRKSGFLIPQARYSDELGFGIKNTFFWALAPNYDLTFGGTYLTNQGFLGDVEWRHRLENGQYNLRVAGIRQENPRDFKAATIDSLNEERIAIMSAGRFQVTPRWTFGWNWLHQSDEDFARTYRLQGYSERNITNQVYLTGLAGKNYFDVRAQQFLIQDLLNDQDGVLPGIQKFQDQQATALPVLDLNRVSEGPVAGGELSLDINIRNNYRHQAQVENYDGLALKAPIERFHGIAGDSSRGSIESEWRRSEIVNGSVVTASLSGRADGVWQDTENLASDLNPLMSNESLWRGMGAGMLEIRYPLVAHDGFASHLFEPIAQVIVRPNETHIGTFPNEDAQSVVFSTDNLFEQDKFSGFDRVEGGTRANIGFRYSAGFLNGASIDVAFGQSYHLAGQNSFAQGDLVNAGLDSGLETRRSDFVGSAELNTGHGLSFGLGGRFDEKNMALRRGALRTAYVSPNYSFGSGYTFIDAQPNYGALTRRHELNATGSVNLTDRWRTFGSMAFDLESSNLYQRGIGLAYDDSCFSFSVAYNRTDNRYTGDQTDTTITFRIGLRTIGDYSYSYSPDDAQ